MYIKDGIVNGILRVIGKVKTDSVEANSVTATTITGSLSGNATTATTASTATTATTATKLGTATKGSATKPIYLNAGTPTECSELATAADVTAKFNDAIDSINGVSEVVGSQIITGTENGWRYKIFPDNSVILSKRWKQPLTQEGVYGSSGDTYYSTQVDSLLPTSFTVNSGCATGTSEYGTYIGTTEITTNSSNQPVLRFRVMRGGSIPTAVHPWISMMIEGSLNANTGTEYEEIPTVTSSGTAVSSFNIWNNPSRNMKVDYSATRTSDTSASVTLTFTYIFNSSLSTSYTSYAQYVTPTVNGTAQSQITLKTTSEPNKWYGSPIVKTATYSITGLSASTTSIPVSCKFTSGDPSDADVTKTGTISISKYSS